MRARHGWFGFEGVLTAARLRTTGTLIGSLVGFSILMRYVLKGNPQAGLPLLNGGALIGFFLSTLLVYRTLLPPSL